MDNLLSFIGYVFNFSMLAAFALFCFKFIQAKKNSGEKKQVQNLNAKLSMLRMTLKAKIKSKSFKYRSQFKTGVISGDPIDLALNELLTLGLENGDDIQRYFDVCRKINSLLISEAAKDIAAIRDESQKESVGKEDYMGTDFKSEIAILRLIKDMVEVSILLNKRIDHYNATNVKNPIARVNTLNFPSLMEVNRVFSSEKNVTDDKTQAA